MYWVYTLTKFSFWTCRIFLVIACKCMIFFIHKQPKMCFSSFLSHYNFEIHEVSCFKLSFNVRNAHKKTSSQFQLERHQWVTWVFPSILRFIMENFIFHEFLLFSKIKFFGWQYRMGKPSHVYVYLHLHFVVFSFSQHCHQMKATSAANEWKSALLWKQMFLYLTHSFALFFEDFIVHFHAATTINEY